MQLRPPEGPQHLTCTSANCGLAWEVWSNVWIDPATYRCAYHLRYADTKEPLHPDKYRPYVAPQAAAPARATAQPVDAGVRRKMTAADMRAAAAAAQGQGTLL